MKVRLIDADALKKIFEEHKTLFVDGWGGFSNLPPKEKARVDELDNCIADVMNATTIDAVEVVRCKDCKNRDGCLCPMYDYGEFPWLPTSDDGFCSFGEKNTNTEEVKRET